MQNINFSKSNGLVPAIIQDVLTHKVLMLGYMNEEALKQTIETKKVTFYSRSKQRLWVKGEESGHFLYLEDILLDCDQDTLLVLANPAGPVCHTGADTCWQQPNQSMEGMIRRLEQTIEGRRAGQDKDSYVYSLFEKGINKIAQKVGEEAVEMVIEAKDNNDELFLNESADLFFHYLILLRAKGYSMSDVTDVLRGRMK